MQSLKKIVVIGPESTGKSSLCSLLAEHYGTTWVPEYAREYLLTNGKDYTYDTLLTVAKGQLALEDKISSQFTPDSPQFLFVDTDMYVMKVWCEFVFGKCHQLIIDEVVKRKYDLYLLCNTDLPWVKDELREYPDLETREKLFHIYKDLLINQSTPWVEVKGDYEERIKMAIDAVDAFF
ncbi:MAG TPA: ATP-binding protein [Puia sp.]|nr:ATP-binding protein [Puia sp.]